MKERWEKYRLLDICDVYQPATISKKALVPNGKYDVYGANGVIGKYDKFNHEESEVLLGCRGACGCINVSSPRSWVNGNAMVVHPRTSELSKAYLVYILKTLDYTNIITGTAQPQITRTSLSNVEVPVPPLSEQDKIVSFLDAEFAKIDALKANIEQQLQASKDLFQSALKQYLTPQEGWIKGCLGNFLNFRRGYDLTHAEMKEGDVPVAGSSGIIGYHNEATNISPCITVGRSGSVGKLNIYDKCWAHNTTLFVDDFKGNDPYFLAYLIQSLGVGSYSGGSAVPSLNRNYIHPIPTAVPLSKKEQRDIVVILDTLSEKVALLQKNYDQTITLCNDLKQSLLKSIFE